MPPLRIFLVEDSPMLRELLGERLVEIVGVILGGEADTEDAAFARLSTDPCEIVILDIELHQGNGIQLLRRLNQRNDVNKQIRILFSNNAAGAYRRAAAAVGVDFFFDKTTELPALLSLLAQLGARKEVLGPLSGS